MKKASILAAILLLGAAAPALAQFKVGDRVKIGSTNEYGTVIEIGAPLYGGGNMIKVHLDRFGDAYPNTGVTYDPVRSKVEQSAVAAPGGGGNGGNTPPGGGNAPSNGILSSGSYMNAAQNLVKSFPAGSRVYIGSMKEWGTVLGIGRGGAQNMLNVHLDRFGNSKASVDFDPVGSKLQAPGANTPADPNPKGVGGNEPGGAGANQGQGGNQAQDINQGDVQVADNAPPTDETFKNLIRAHYPNTLEYKTSVSFTAYSNNGPTQYVDRFAGHLDQETILGGPGHQYKAWKVHAKFTVVEHYGDPLADDVSRDYEGDYMCYKDFNGHWIAAGQNVTIAPTQYIHKK